MVDEHLIAQRLAAIRDHVARIDSCLPSEREQFLTDRNSQEIVPSICSWPFRMLWLSPHT